MRATLDSILASLQQHPLLEASFWLGALVVSAWLANWVIKKILLRWLFQFLRASPFSAQLANDPDVGVLVNRLSNVLPVWWLANGIETIPSLPGALVHVVQNVGQAFIVLSLAMAVSRLLTVSNKLYERRADARARPIKGLVQIGKILIYCLAAILVVATLVDRSPLILLSGLGAMAAVVLFVFQHTLLSLVASMQLSTNDVIRVGDWIEMPELNANGLVTDIALHTVTVQNWDNTVTSIPTKRLIMDPFKNWRAMQESGGRRIMRSLFIDQSSVHFLSQEEREHLQRFRLLQQHLENKQTDIDDWNQQLEALGKEPLNRRHITNLGCFRAYVEAYVAQHPDVHDGMSRLVRQLAPSPEGIPLEVYCFTRETSWEPYERIQADLFDHLLAILPEFGLTLYQHPTGRDLRTLRQS